MASKHFMAKIKCGTIILTMVIPMRIKVYSLDQSDLQIFFMKDQRQYGEQDICEFANMRIPGLLMPRKCQVSIEDAVAVVERFIDHFRTNQFPKWSDDVWKEMSKALGGAWSAECTYQNVRKDHRRIVTLARKNQGISQQEQKNVSIKNVSEISDSDESSKANVSSSSAISTSNNNTIKHVVLTEKEWDSIKPTDADKKLKLKPKVWTNVVSDALWLQYRMPCAFMFKRAEVRKSENELCYQITFTGTCKSEKCGNNIKGTAEKNINEEGITFALDMRDTRTEKHDVVTRPLNGKKREEAYGALMAEGCAKYRKCRAKEIMLPGDIVPPTLPTNEVLRQAKKEGNDKNLGIEKQSRRDIVGSLEDMALSPKYCGLMHEVAGFRFRVMYGSPSQLRVYQEFRRLNRSDYTISLDATGGLVSKLPRSNGTKSSDIFLYAIVSNFSGITASVYQMLSERHDSVTIMMWLFSWVGSGAAPPKQTVCDYSRALLMAISMAFNKQTIKGYINDRFTAVSNSNEIKKPPVTFIRIDVAHFIHMVCRWKSFQHVRQRAIKDFYLHCVALLIECQTRQSFEGVFILTCAVALQTNEDAVISLSEASTAKQARKKLEHLISMGTVRDDFKDYDTQSKRDVPFHQSFVDDERENDNDAGLNVESEDTSIGKWIDSLVTRAQNVRVPGEVLNAFYLPDFINRFTGVAKEFPLWTAVGMPPNTQRASSSYVEGYFNDLKTRVLEHYQLPISVDKFIRVHVNDIAGANCLISGEMVQYNNDRLHHMDIASDFHVEKKMETARELKIDKEIEPSGEVKDSEIIKPAESETVENTSYHAGIISENVIEGHDSDFFAVENWRGKGDAAEFNRHTEDAISGEPNFPEVVKVPYNYNEVLVAVDSYNASYNTQGDVNNNADRNKVYNYAQFDHSYSKDSNDEQLTYSDFAATLENRVDFQSTKRQALEEPPITKPVKTSKYFKPYPEISQQNARITDQKRTQVKAAALLPNGSRRGAVVLEGRTYFVRNTCAFDSVAQVLATAGIDNVDYRAILQIATNSTLKFIFNFIAQGLSTELFIERARILLNFCKPTSQGQIGKKEISWEINAWTSVANVVNHTLSSVPSARDIEDCCTCAKRTIHRTLLSPNHNIITGKGFNALEEALQFGSSTLNKTCRNGCSGKFSRTSTPNVHIFIELDVRHSNDCNKPLQCILDNFPKVLSLRSSNQETCSQYRLAGIVERLPGHYIAHCLRIGGVWQKFNDMDKKVGNSGTKTRIEPHLAIYVQETKRN